ncbi:TrkH-domain-containing protein [Myriangium duriaei CBS 260.36]|uniref:TrkH-domain-containing protein n=1 Tax=Myriangium duriaei CBS 260.36 TaxID=1168546 RepID=A0A9P4IYG6_9PEZI|nr:TrkH-domain-containing protein [Myriangium duriaei CBS 260.36]
MLSSIIFWGASTASRNVTYTDSLFLVTSAMTLAGLNTINLSTINTFQQVMLFLLTLAGSAIFVSAFVVQFRRRAFVRKFEDIIKENHGHPISSSEDVRDRLGGVEYRAVCLLSWLVPLYFISWQVISCIGLGAYVAMHRADTARQNGMNPFWVGAFNAVSAFNNNGMSLLDANMTAFQDAYYMLLTMSLLILAGNTCFPVFLRLIIWTMYKSAPSAEKWQETKSTLKYLLDHPRRCYTNLFPSRHTWWLFITVVFLNLTDWIGFEVLNIGNEALNSVLPLRLRIVDGLFQAFAIRSGGFYVVPIPLLRISVQVLYVVMMYISVYPVVITMRNSNVYEERSLGIYSDDPTAQGHGRSNSRSSQSVLGRIIGIGRHVSELQESRSYFVRQQIQAQLAHDIWWLVLAVFLIMIVEGDKFHKDPTLFSVFNVILETVSAYGTVGISVGVPYDNYSFCGAWKVLSKLILCAVMLRGRHRGLPVAIDRAILLPGERLAQEEEEAAMHRLASRNKIEEEP